jgi:hypothetical protein
MNIEFFAADEDLFRIAQWLSEVDGLMLFERYSRPDQPNRWFSTAEEIAEILLAPGQGLGAWLEATGARPTITEIVFNPETQHRFAAKGRMELTSPSLITIRRDADQRGALGATNAACWTEKGAKQRSIFPTESIDQVDWKALRSFMGRLRRMVIKSSPAKLHSFPIMENAFNAVRTGRITLWAWATPNTYPSPHITLVQERIIAQG